MNLKVLLALVLFIVGSFQLVSARTYELRITEAQIGETEKNLARAAELAVDYFLQNRQELTNRATLTDFRVLARAVRDGKVTELLDSLESPRFVVKGDQGQHSEKVYNHPILGLIDFGFSLKLSEDRENMLQTYTGLYESLPAKYRGNLLSPQRLRAARTNQIKASLSMIDNIIHKYFDLIISERPVRPVRNPMRTATTEELGYISHPSSTIDDGAAQCAPDQYHPRGIVKRTSLAMRSALTSIKSQGVRGTCVAFAYAATIESEKILRGRGAQNLSEQNLYGYSKIALNGMNREDGLVTANVAPQLRDLNYGFIREGLWIYNRSNNRTSGFFENGEYQNSCVGYHQQCSEQSSQAVQNADGFWMLQGLMNGPSIRSFRSLVTSSSEASMQRLIAIDRPAVVAIQTDRLFRNSQFVKDGYIRLDRNYGENRKGGHAMMYVGFVPNSRLPYGVNNASGPGYLVFKNSYGVNSHDCGFYYLDYDYVKDRLTSALVLNI